MLEHDLAMTVTLEDDSFELDLTLPGKLLKEQSSQPVSPPVELIVDPEALVGEMFGHFKIISPIGRGGMGQVYRALDTSLQRYAAVKILRSGISAAGESGSSEKEVDKLLQEAVSQARVTHPNVVTIYYVGKQDGDPFLAMELVNGEPLSKRIADSNIPFDEIGPIAIELAYALKISHEIGIIHGDIKPSNVLITKNGTAKLSDFGMARDVSDESAAVGGTPNYIAPEILTGQKPTIQSDIYALGVTLFEMTFGSLPVVLSGRTVDEWVKIHERNEPEFPNPWPAHLPERWKSLLKRMLAKKPSQRYQSYESLLADLKQVQPESKVSARIFPRLVAAGIDWITVLFLAGFVQYLIRTGTLDQPIEKFPISMTLLRIADFLPMIAYMVIIYFWRQSLGRNLMHLRVINQFGMKPRPLSMVGRSMIRMQFPFVAICLQVFSSFNSSSVQFSLSILFVLSLIFLVVDSMLMVIFRPHRSFHDIVTKTRVVLDTQNQT